MIDKRGAKNDQIRSLFAKGAKKDQRRVLGGTYALIMFLEKDTTIRSGALGRFRFPRGYYIYTGSALNGLDARVRRHLSRNKRVFWHIDYFLRHAQIIDIWTQPGRRRLECAWADKVLALDNAHVVAERFGASDCSCRTHLIHLGRDGVRPKGRSSDWGRLPMPGRPWHRPRGQHPIARMSRGRLLKKATTD